MPKRLQAKRETVVGGKQAAAGRVALTVDLVERLM